MKFFLLIISGLFAFGFANGQTTALDSMHVKEFNLTSFGVNPALSTTDMELHDLVNPAYYNHPEFGQLPFNVGLDNVIELIDKRTEYTRTLVKQGSHGKDIFIQKAYSPLNFLDNNGWWRTIDERLHPSQQNTGLFEANAQLAPTFIDAANKYAGVKNGTDVLKFNSGLSLYYENATGSRTLVANADWTNYTAGFDGVKVINIFPGIDLEMIVSGGKIKTNYKINSPIVYPNGWLVIEDHPGIPSTENAAFTNAVYDQNGLNFSEIDIKDVSNNLKFTLSPAYGYDQSGNASATVPFGEKLVSNNQWDIFIPVSWTGNSALQFPLVVDPLVSSSATTLQVAITGSFQQASGLFTSSCDYPMAVPTPANCTITDMQWSFNYIAQNGAALCYGAIDFLVGPSACRSPATAGAYWFCNNCIFAGTCTGTNVSMWADVSSCIPAPQCLSYNINCVLRFYARAVTGAGCSNFYIGANSNWIMTIVGHTVEHPAAPASSNGTTICLGSNTTLTANPTYGVPPYTYLWAPGSATTQSIVVAPTATTTYTCTITDVCGNTAVANVTITVNTISTLTPAPVMSYSMSPASGNPCPVTVTFCTNVGNNYGGGSETFQWNFGGGSQTTGGALSGSANGPDYGGAGVSASCSGSQRFYTVVYSVPGSYYPSVTIFKGGACATTSLPITICGVLPVELMSFTGDYNANGQVMLKWSTATETNNYFFTVERTTDGINYEEVDHVGTKAFGGNSISRLDYSLIDENPFLNGTSYYRLKQTDVNGIEKTFPMISVMINKETPGLSIHPNPANETTTISFDANTGTNYVRVFDNTGRLVKEIPVEVSLSSNQSITLDMSELNQGFYFVQVSSGDKIYNGKLLRK